MSDFYGLASEEKKTKSSFGCSCWKVDILIYFIPHHLLFFLPPLFEGGWYIIKDKPGFGARILVNVTGLNSIE